jgi:hypothetical protein
MQAGKKTGKRERGGLKKNHPFFWSNEKPPIALLTVLQNVTHLEKWE